MASPERRRTPGAAVELSGVGVHSGQSARARIEPAPWGTGIVLGPWGGPVWAVHVDRAVADGGATTLVCGQERVSTVEHLLAAIHGAGITDARVLVRGGEVPILDGSALPWVEALERVGTASGPPVERIEVVEVVRVEQGRSWAELRPGDGLVVEVAVDFDDPRLPRGRASVDLDPATFREEVAWARTFVLQRDVDRLRAAGRGRGASLENTALIGHDWATAGLRRVDEVVRHKLLDAVGDLVLAGAPLCGRVVVHRGSHALHHALIRAWLHRRADAISRA